MIDALLKLLVCPQCRGLLASVEGDEAYVCNSCKFKYPIRDGIPILTLEEALDLKSRPHTPDGATIKLPRVSFRVMVGPDNNMTFQLEQGTCRAVGRASSDPNKTTVFNVDIALALDEGTRSLILQYVSRQFRKSAGVSDVKGDRFGQFRRAPDVILTDLTLSKLHAMIFSDPSGVGVLDLVSKNGTFVNGEEVESKILKRGDVIELGETSISFEG